MSGRLPSVAPLLGAAGLIPFIGTGLGAISASDIVRASMYAMALIGYGAVILSFLGGVHWGFVLTPVPSETAGRASRTGYRLVLGVLPALIGWVAVLIAVGGLTQVALIVLIAGFVAFTFAEASLKRSGLMPASYMWLRWVLSSAVVVILAIVLLFRLIGGQLAF